MCFPLSLLDVPVDAVFVHSGPALQSHSAAKKLEAVNADVTEYIPSLNEGDIRWRMAKPTSPRC